MKKAMLSQPMAGKTDEEIRETREKAIAALKRRGYEIVNTLFTDEWYSKEKMEERGVVQVPLCFLAKSLENMSLCHAAYFCKDWEKARGCKIEHDAAVAYGLDIIYEDKENDLVQLSTLKAGETFKIAEHDFIVLEQMQGQAAVISKGFMVKNVKFNEDTTDYNESSLKKMIETDIQPVIEKSVGAENIVEHEVDLISVDMQNQYPKCKCKVRPITFDEVRKYNDLLVNKSLKDWWWTCTPWSTEKRGLKYRVTVCSPSGYVNDYLCSDNFGVRPFCILKSNIFVSKEEK